MVLAVLAAASVMTTLLLLAGCKPISLQADLDAEMPTPMRMEAVLQGPIQAELALQSVEYRGTFVSEKLFDEIELNTTTRLYLIGLLGEPDRIADVGGGDELLVYRYEPVEQSQSLVSLFGTDGAMDPRFVTTVFRVRGGVVVEKLQG